jgi:hypothetical protein
MSTDVLQWLELRRLLRDAADAATHAADDADIDIVRADAPAEPLERERVIELGVTGFIVRFPDNAVLVGAISRVQGWRPNPAGSHHVPANLKAITGMLAFAEMYDFELTDGADAMVRLLIRQSYRGRSAGPVPATVPTEAVEVAPALPSSGTGIVERARIIARELLGPQLARTRRHWKPLLAIAALLYLASPRIDVLREPERAYLEHAQLGAAASVTTVLDALQRCESASLVPGSPPPPGCAATVATRPAYERVSLAILNPVARVASWDSIIGLRGFVLCDQSKPLEACWDR